MSVEEGGDRFVQTCHRAQFRIPVRIRQEAHIENVVGIDRDTMLEAERFEDHRQLTFAFA